MWLASSRGEGLVNEAKIPVQELDSQRGEVLFFFRRIRCVCMKMCKYLYTYKDGVYISSTPFLLDRVL